MEVQLVRTKAEFDAVMDCQWAGFAQPPEEFWTIWFPLDLKAHVASEAKRADAVAESKERLWKEHLTDPHSHWIYIAATSTSTATSSSTDDGAQTAAGVAAAPYCLASCQWRIYENPTNPFAAGMPDLQCSAWPTASAGSKFAKQLAEGIFTPRATRFARPHVGLSWMTVRPEWRQRGLGSRLMEWGLDRADSLELEGYIEGSDLGQLLYERHGFREICEFWVDMSLPDGDASQAEEWKALNRYYLPRGFHGHAMWRPIRGAWNEVVDESWKDGFDFWTSASKHGKAVLAATQT